MQHPNVTKHSLRNREHNLQKNHGFSFVYLLVRNVSWSPTNLHEYCDAIAIWNSWMSALATRIRPPIFCVALVHSAINILEYSNRHLQRKKSLRYSVDKLCLSHMFTSEIIFEWVCDARQVSLGTVIPSLLLADGYVVRVTWHRWWKVRSS